MLETILLHQNQIILDAIFNQDNLIELFNTIENVF